MALPIIQMHYDMVKYAINDKLKDVEPANVVVLTAGATFALAYIYSQLTDKVDKFPTLQLRLTITKFWNYNDKPVINKRISPMYRAPIG